MIRTRKILIFSYYFPPAGGISCQRIIRFSKFLKEYGWHPVIIAGRSKTLWKILDNSLQKIEKKFDVITYPSKNSEIYYSTKSGIIEAIRRKIIAHKIVRELDPMRDWTLEVGRNLAEIISTHKPELALITVPPFSSLELVEVMKRTAPKIPVVADMRDLLWIFYPYGSLLRRYAGKKQYRNAQYLVPKYLSLVDGIIAPDRSFFTTLKEYSTAPMAEIPTPFDPDDFSNLPEYRRSGNFTILHSGSLNKFHDPEQLKKIFSLLPDDVLARIELILQGHHLPVSKKIFSDVKWAKILPSVSHREALSMQVSADANIVFVSVPIKYGGAQIIPGKVFDYIGAGRPIIAIAPKDGALNSLVEKFNLGFSAPIENFALAAGTITKAFRLWEQGVLSEISEESREGFSATEVVRKLSEFLESVSS
ncbi:hypothetical protein J7M00_07935 [bacterium]|nr:hypothetical protein [bacterium]